MNREKLENSLENLREKI